MTHPIFFSEPMFNLELSKYEKIVPKLNECVKAFNNLGLEPLEKNELVSLFANPATLVFDKMTKGKQFSVGGLEVDKQKFFDVIVKPPGYESLLAKVQDVFNAAGPIKMDPFNSAGSVPKIMSWYVLDNGEVVLTEAKRHEIRRRHEIHASSEQAVKVYEFGEAVLELIEETNILESIKGRGYNINHFAEFFSELFIFDINRGAKINHVFVDRFNGSAD